MTMSLAPPRKRRRPMVGSAHSTAGFKRSCSQYRRSLWRHRHQPLSRSAKPSSPPAAVRHRQSIGRARVLSLILWALIVVVTLK